MALNFYLRHTITKGYAMSHLFLSALFTIGLLTVAARGETNIVFPKDAKVPSVIDYGATPDDDTDDTAAFQKALVENHKLIYVPDGRYLISETLRWGKGQKRQVLQGQSQSKTIIQLVDNAKAFQNIEWPQPMLWTGKAPAQRFRNGIHNLTIDIGMGNPGAIPARFIANNQGGIEFVTFRDRSGVGPIGLDLGYTDEQGPCLIKGVVVEGFDVGVSVAHAVDSVTIEHMTLRNQRTVGIRNIGQVLNIRGLKSENEVPAIQLNGASLVTLLDSELTGKGEAQKGPAIINDAAIFARNVKTPGYALAIKNNKGHGKDATGNTVEEFVSHDVLSLFDSPKKSLNLPIKETPDIAWEPVEKWVSVAAFGPAEEVTLVRNGDGKKFKVGNWAPALQRAIDSGATTIYFPCDMNDYGLFGPIHLRNNVQRIIGLETTPYKMVASTHVKSMFPDEFTPTFILDEGTAPAVVIERFDTWYTPFDFTQNSQRSLVVHSLSFHGLQTKENGGDVFLEDLRAKQIVVKKGAHVWARQINPEGAEEPRVLVDGGNMWVLGLKTEDDNTIAIVDNGGKLEVAGGFIYANKDNLWPKQMFINRGGSLTATVGEWVTKRDSPFNILIQTRDGEERLMARKTIYGRGTGSLVPLLVSYPAPATPGE